MKTQTLVNDHVDKMRADRERMLARKAKRSKGAQRAEARRKWAA